LDADVGLLVFRNNKGESLGITIIVQYLVEASLLIVIILGNDKSGEGLNEVNVFDEEDTIIGIRVRDLSLVRSSPMYGISVIPVSIVIPVVDSPRVSNLEESVSDLTSRVLDRESSND
jgi:hypothetical protein